MFTYFLTSFFCTFYFFPEDLIKNKKCYYRQGKLDDILKILFIFSNSNLPFITNSYISDIVESVTRKSNKIIDNVRGFPFNNLNIVENLKL